MNQYTYRKEVYNKYDPIFVFLDRVIFKLLFEPPKANKSNETESLEAAEYDFLIENLNKHRLMLWLNILLIAFLQTSGIDQILNSGNESIVISGLLAPAMVTGAAWFAISFGGIPEKFIAIAYYLTLFMFLSFSLSMTLLTFILIAITPWQIGILILLPIYITLYISSMLYDNVDGLKIGLDSTLLKFSRASLNYYQKHGLITKRETQIESFGEDTISSSEISIFSYYIKNLERNIDQLEEEKGLTIANHLIISSTDILYEIIDTFIPNSKIDKGSSYDEYLNNGYKETQKEIDAQTVHHLINIIKLMDETLNEEQTTRVLKNIKDKLNNFIINPSKDATDDEDAQYFSDHIFCQSFRQILELMSAYRHILFNNNS